MSRRASRRMCKPSLPRYPRAIKALTYVDYPFKTIDTGGADEADYPSFNLSNAPGNRPGASLYAYDLRYRGGHASGMLTTHLQPGPIIVPSPYLLMIRAIPKGQRPADFTSSIDRALLEI